MKPTFAAAFDDLGLSAASLAAVERFGFQRPTRIQELAIPHVLAGRDVIGGAETGTGKTLAFALPLLQRVEERSLRHALVLAPTRELAEQIGEQSQWIASERPLRVAVAIGGVGIEPQVAALKPLPHLLVATPGRLLELAERGSVPLSAFDALVLDEADRMLDLGFEPQLARILEAMSRRKQTLLFSATISGEVERFAHGALRRPERAIAAPVGSVPKGLTQIHYRVEPKLKKALLLFLLDRRRGRTLVFVKSKVRCDEIWAMLKRGRVNALRLHADRSQNQRKMALDFFGSGRCRVLVATDLAARGLDIDDVEHVVNYDMPATPEVYLHRIGRTARVAKKGDATSFVTDDDRTQLFLVESFLGREVHEAKLPEHFPAFAEKLHRKGLFGGGKARGGTDHGRT